MEGSLPVSTKSPGKLADLIGSVTPLALRRLRSEIEERVDKVPIQLNEYGYDAYGMQPEFVRRATVEPVDLSRMEQDALEATALSLARAHLSTGGFGAMAEVAVTKFMQDPFGSYHVRMEQLHD